MHSGGIGSHAAATKPVRQRASRRDRGLVANEHPPSQSGASGHELLPLRGNTVVGLVGIAGLRQRHRSQ